MSGEEQEGVPVFLGWCSLGDNHVTLIIFRDECEFLADSVLGISRDLAFWSRLLQPLKLLAFFPLSSTLTCHEGKKWTHICCHSNLLFSEDCRVSCILKRGH